MGSEALARRVNQHVVQPRLQSTFFGQPEIAAYPNELWSEGSHPSRLVDRDPTLGDLPRVADAAIETSLVLKTVTGWPGNLAQPTRGARSDRQPDAAHVLDCDVEITRRGGPACCERAGCTSLGELSADFFQYGIHLCNPFAAFALPCSPNLLVTSMPCRLASQRSAEDPQHHCLRRQSGSAIIAGSNQIALADLECTGRPMASEAQLIGFDLLKTGA